MGIAPPALPEIDPGSRIAHAQRVIAVVDLLAERPIVPALCAAIGEGAVRARLRLRNKPGYERIEEGWASHPEALFDATRALLAGLPPHRVLIAEGPALVALLRVDRAVLGTSSPSLFSLEADVRSVRDRFDLVLYDFRPAVVAAVAHRLVA
ncbi:MAG: hypothetical protein U0234_13475 [Sandaracinus sp.]